MSVKEIMPHLLGGFCRLRVVALVLLARFSARAGGLDARGLLFRPKGAAESS